jgi:hypothetical protein
MERPAWAPDDVDMDAPSPARVYDALLGGFHNFEVDREAARAGTAMVPDLPFVASANRRFLRRAVRHLVACGIRQFIDIGAGIPTAGNTHEIAQTLDARCRVAYVDIDAVAVAHATSILDGDDSAVAVQGDLRAPDALLEDPGLRRIIDLDEPVGLLMVAVLHLLTDDDDPDSAVAALREAVAAGSHLAISHLTSAHRPDETARLRAHVEEQDRISLVFRPRERIDGFFDGFAYLPPGLVSLSDWRPDDAESVAAVSGADTLMLVGVGRKG